MQFVQKCRDLRINLGKSSKISDNTLGEKIALNLENVHPCSQNYTWDSIDKSCKKVMWSPMGKKKQSMGSVP